MEGAQNVSYGTIDLDQSLDVLQLEGESLYTDYSLTFEINNNTDVDGTDNDKNRLPNISSNYLNDFGLAEDNLKELECIENEVVVRPKKGLMADKINGDLGDELAASYVDDLIFDCPDKSLDNRTDFFDSKVASDTNNVPLIAGNDIVLSKHINELARKDSCPKNPELTDVLTNDDTVDAYVEALDGTDLNSIKIPQQSATNFERKNRPGQSRLIGEENVHCGPKIRIPKRKSRRMSSAMVADYLSTTNSASRKSMMRPNKRGRNRNAITKKCRNASLSVPQTTSDYQWNPVPSPEAEVPTFSPINIDEYIREEELMAIGTKELNRRVKCLPRKIVKEIKHRRRTLKNRGYARSCREKKINEADILQKSNVDLEKELASLKLELEVALLQKKEWKLKYERLASGFIREKR